MTIDRDELNRLLAEAAASGPAGSFRVAQACKEHLGIDGVAVSVTSTGGARTLVCATDEQARQVEEAQTTTGVGPSIDAIGSAAPVLVPDLRDLGQGPEAEQRGDRALRWVGFLDMAQGAGVRALFCLPVRVGSLTIGVLALYRRRPGDMSTDETAAAVLAADAVACCLLAQDQRPDQQDGALPWPAADAGVVVHQATGMVSVQLQTSMSGALLMLRARAFHEGRLLSQIAQDVVDRRTRFTRERP